MCRVVVFCCIFLYIHWATPQHIGWKKVTLYSPFPDSVKLDVNTIPEDKWYVQFDTTSLPKNLFKLNINTSVIYLDLNYLKNFDSISIYWLPLNVNLSRTYFRKDSSILQKSTSTLPLFPVNENMNNRNSHFFETGTIEKSGSFTRGITIGNRQDPGLNSTLNLSLRGKLTDDIELSAYITDNKLPVQPDGTTTQIQEIDNIYIQLQYKKFLLNAGDIDLSSKNSYFLRYHRKVQGIKIHDKVSSVLIKNDSLTYYAGLSISRGQYAKITLIPIEGNQGPYRLHGKNNETLIMILAGTERVYLDGELLQRGQENDYIINYNTAEITFTNRIQIRSNSRIIIEFQYVDRFYNKFIFASGVEYKVNHWKLRVSSFEERDMKHQSIEPLSDSALKTLYFAGDSLQKAFVPGVRVVPFQKDLILYAMKDSLGYDSVFYYSTNPDSARYLLYFSYVGENKGNYVPDPRLANGKVYRWLSPINGVPQGSYEPIIQVVAPQKASMWNIATSYQPNAFTHISLEYARSNRDLNTLSPFNDENNHGNALRLNVAHSRPIKLFQDSTTTWKTNLQAETTDSLFSPIEKYLPIEFERNWSINQRLTSYQLIEIKSQIQSRRYTLMLQNASLRQPLDLISNRTTYNWQIKQKRWHVLQFGSYTTPIRGKQIPFFQYNNILSLFPWKLKLHVAHTGEMRKTNLANVPDTNQFRWNQVLTFVQNADTSQWLLRPYYRTRLDEKIKQNLFTRVRQIHEIGIQLLINRFPKTHWQTDISYQWFPVLPDSSIKSHFYQMKHQIYKQLLKGFVSLSLNYQNNIGRENKKEFFFLEVAPGQGTHTWIDYNHNGIKEINEFLLAQFADQANYIKLLLPTSIYQTVYNIYSSGDFVIDATRLNIKHPSWKWLSGLRNNFSFQLNNKNTSPTPLHHFLPYQINDSFQLFSSYSLREQVSYQSTDGKINLLYFFSNRDFSQSFFYGNDNQTNKEHQVQAMIQIRKPWYAEPRIYNKIQQNISVVSFVQNYKIYKQGYGLTTSYQHTVQWRTSVGSTFEISRNLSDTTQFKKLTIAIEHRHTFTARGNVYAKFQYQRVFDLNKALHPYMEYIMLDGFKAGKNFAWEVTLMRRVDNNIELTFMYTGRALPHETVIHTGSAQIRIIF